jgi:alkanesulfonate monooxygenase SsuD/methylene tetrahydromethanopterin reductase-like flavin-dependent oxidoreductase (luciferase family)
LHVHPFHTPKYLREYVHPAVEDGLRVSERSSQDFAYATASFVVIGDTERERAANTEWVRQQIAFYASTRTYEPVLAAHGWEGIAPELHQKSLDGDWKAMARLITDEMLDTIAVSGTYESIGTKLQERYAGLVDRIALYQPYESADETRRAALVRQFKT